MFRYTVSNLNVNGVYFWTLYDTQVDFHKPTYQTTRASTVRDGHLDLGNVRPSQTASCKEFDMHNLALKIFHLLQFHWLYFKANIPTAAKRDTIMRGILNACVENLQMQGMKKMFIDGVADGLEEFTKLGISIQSAGTMPSRQAS